MIKLISSWAVMNLLIINFLSFDLIQCRINWKGNNWASGCDFKGNDLSHVRVSAEQCGGKCASTHGCTHFSWSKWNGGTCWMKKGHVSKSNAFSTKDWSMVCGVKESSKGEWVRVWEDNFDWNGGIDTNKWEFDVGVGENGWGNNEKQYYTNNRVENARCELFPGSNNGRLIVEARQENMENCQFTSARLKSKAKWTYGRLQIRAKLPTGRGLWPALWMLPEKHTYGNAYWPDNGEIDLMEQVGYDPLRIHSTVHTQANNHMKNNHPSNSIIVSDAVSNFKIYTLDWNVDKIEMFVGDNNNPLAKRIFIWNKQGNWTKWPFDKPFFVIINIAVGGNCNLTEANEKIWSHGMGNAYNTHRRIPTIPTAYNGESWELVFNLSKSIKSIPSMAVGINGDIYFFTGNHPIKSPEYLVCVTINGLIRWKLYLERDDGMTTTGVTNIVSNMNGTLFYGISWFNDTNYLNKICRLSNPETNNPIEKCASNTYFSQTFQGPLSIDDSSELLIVTLYGESFAFINTTSLKIEYQSPFDIGASSSSHYNTDQTGIYWIGVDDHLRKVNILGETLINVEVNGGGNQNYAFNKQQNIIVGVGQNFTTPSAPFVVSAWNVDSNVNFTLLWQLSQSVAIATSSTHPVVDDKTNIAYVSILPYISAIDSHGNTLWKTEITSLDEIYTYSLVTSCLTLNTETSMAYVLISTFDNSNQQTPKVLFIVPVKTTTGVVLPRINIEVHPDVLTYVQCPMLVENQMLYLPWYYSSDTDSLPLYIIGIPQITSS
ncbi:unnamed protein product [Rotaria magnacalcarata]|uniref:GH16 domain-containing protein n=2 Tax=Rotaria magnacalcarata TaxID=392030 RepID=A0A8S2KC22_9BILA|nr:unnamed protein product [Rotaria magnacalcarata]CAF3862889.1 unnamed protein product [Rotaria magnacalcarata]